MAKFDQAEGLRRLLEVPRQRVLTCLSVLPPAERNRLTINLAATFARQGRQTLMVDAHSRPGSLSSWLNLKNHQTLLEVACQQRSMESVMKNLSSRLSVTRLVHSMPQFARFNAVESRALSKVFDLAASKSDVVVVDCEADLDGSLLLSSFYEADLLVQMSCDAQSIKHAYSLIKLINQRHGRQSCGIVVSGGAGEQAERVFSNLSLTARKYLGIELDFVGAVADDAHWRRATELGRAVVDAFPASKAAGAFLKIADRLISMAHDGLRFDSVSAFNAQTQIQFNAQSFESLNAQAEY